MRADPSLGRDEPAELDEGADRRLDVESAVSIEEVIPDRALDDAENVGDLEVGPAGRPESEDLELAPGETAGRDEAATTAGHRYGSWSSSSGYCSHRRPSSSTPRSVTGAADCLKKNATPASTQRSRRSAAHR